MLNMVATVNFHKVFTWQRGYNDCMAFHRDGKPIHKIFAVEGATGVGKNTWLYVAMCLYMLGWAAAREKLLKYHNKVELRNVELLDKPRQQKLPCLISLKSQPRYANKLECRRW